MANAMPADQVPPLHVGPDGTVFRPVPGDALTLRGQCPNGHGQLVHHPGGQLCRTCQFKTNLTPVLTDLR
jgi:hypothetical protein